MAEKKDPAGVATRGGVSIGHLSSCKGSASWVAGSASPLRCIVSIAPKETSCRLDPRLDLLWPKFAARWQVHWTGWVAK
jgi:hypothetical protein